MTGSESCPETTAHGCLKCGEPADMLLAEPDVWLCRACSDALGEHILEDPS